MILEGAIVDAEGTRAGYVRIRRGRVVESGPIGTDSARGRERKVRGIAVPEPVNAHTHLGDAVSAREPPHQPLAQIVRPPDGYKFRLLKETPPTVKARAMRLALRRLDRERVGAVIDFREEGLPGVELLRSAAAGLAVRTVALGRPLSRPLDPTELAALLRVADGVGLSSIAEEDHGRRRSIARACRASGKWYALHASEGKRERPEEYLDPRPDLLVHLLNATAEDLEQVVAERVAVAVCPRSNALFGHRPPLAELERLGARTLLGTDNAMFHAPSMFREVEFAYVSARLARTPVSPGFLVRAGFLEPWRFLGEPERAVVAPESPGRPLLLRLPPEDPEYQVATRATEHLILRAGTKDA